MSLEHVVDIKPKVDLIKDNPLSIGQKRSSTILDLRTLFQTFPISSDLTQKELTALQSRETPDWNIEAIRNYIQYGLNQTNRASESQKHPLQMQFQGANKAVVNGDTTIHATYLYKAARKEGLQVQVGNIDNNKEGIEASYLAVRAMNNRAYAKHTGFRNEIIVYQKLADMIDKHDYSRASSLLLRIARKIWPDHEKK